MLKATHKYMNKKIYLGKSGGWFYFNGKGRKLYCSEKQLLFSKIKPEYKEPLFPQLPQEIEDVIIQYKHQLEAIDDNWYRFLLSLTQHQREVFCLAVGNEAERDINILKKSISLALKHFSGSSRIYRKALIQLSNY